MNITKTIIAATGLGLVASALAVPACTPAERQDAAVVVSALGSIAPLACVFVPASDATVCGNDTTLTSKVAGFVSSVLANWPSSRTLAHNDPPVKLVINGVEITGLTRSQAQRVLASLPDGGVL